MRIDLHTHSSRSDGTDTPTELIANAAAAGLDVVALTDHDATSGWAEAQREADRLGLRLVRGIEISCLLEGHSVHLLGYEFDPDDPALVAELERVLGGRDTRLPAILGKLNGLGIDLTLEEVEAVSQHAVASGRPHVADALIARGVVQDRAEAFDRFLKPGRPAYVQRYAAPLHEAVSLVVAAGGRPVLAHPWSRGSHRVITAELVGELAERGLAGLEVDHNDHDERARRGLRAIAIDLDLVTTGSSDYHGTGKAADFYLGCNTTDPEQFARLLPRLA